MMTSINDPALSMTIMIYNFGTSPYPNAHTLRGCSLGAPAHCAQPERYGSLGFKIESFRRRVMVAMEQLNILIEDERFVEVMNPFGLYSFEVHSPTPVTAHATYRLRNQKTDGFVEFEQLACREYANVHWQIASTGNFGTADSPHRSPIVNRMLVFR